MFGQAPAPSPFGTPGTTPGGASLFGAPAPTFGSPAPAPAFGAPAATPSAGGFGFGSPTPAPSAGFGGFGSTTPAPAPTGFGAFGAPTPAPAFGAPAPSTPFGAPAPAPSGGLFGSTPAPAPAGGLFGGGTTQSTTGFGATAPAPAFGAPAAPTSAFGAPATSAFGAPAPATSGFGATSTFGSSPAPSTGLFGGPRPATTSTFGAPAPAFGAPAPSGGLFGAPAPAPGATTGLFGAPAAGAKPGTLHTPYSDTRISDNNTQITFKSISGMNVPAYNTSSFEELRVADYMAGNKGTQGQNVGTTAFGAQTSTFGSPAPAPAGGLFGAPAPSTFGAPATSAFGSTPATTFGSPAAAPSAFGAPAPAPPGGLFGVPAAAPTTAFGSPAAAPSAFGAPAAPSGGLFGAPAAAPSTGLFGSTPAAPAPSTGFSFGAATPGPATGAFGATPAPATGGLFGSAPAPAPSGGLFGAPAAAPASGGLFGAPAPAQSGGLFGAPAPAPSGGLFGAPAPATGGLFGAPAPAPVGGGLFGAPAPAPTGGLFGAPATAPSTGLFGATAQKPAGGLFGSPAPAGGLFGSTAPAPAFGAAPASSTAYGVSAPGAPVASTSVLVPPSADTLLAHQLAAIETQKKEMAVLEALRGTSPGNRSTSSSGSVIPTSIFQRDAAAVRYRGLAGGGSSSRSGSSYPSLVAPRSTAKVRPRGFGPLASSAALQLTNSQAKIKPMTPSAFIGSATKHLVIKPGALTPKPKIRLLLSDESKNSNRKLERGENKVSQTPLTNEVIRGSVIENDKSKTPLNQTQESSAKAMEKPSPFDVSKIANEEVAFTSPEAVSTTQRISTKEAAKSTSGKKKKTPRGNGESYDYYRTVIGSPQFTEEKTNEVAPQNTSAPILTMDGYVVTPPLSQLSQMTEAELATVSNFAVERVGVGSVAWDGAVDVRGIDLDSILSIEMKDVAVYQKQEETGTKPPEGTKLNRPAVITFHDVYPKGGPESSEEMKKKFDQKLQKHAKGMGAEFIMYDGDNGIWMFRVPHFSRYALVDDSDDEKDEDMTSNMDFESGVDGGSTQSSTEQGKMKKRARLSRIRVPLNDDEEMVEFVNENKMKTHNEEKKYVLETAEAAYKKMASKYVEPGTTYLKKKRSVYADEGETVSEYNTDVPLPLLSPPPQKNFSICDKISSRCGINLNESSSIDYSRRLGKSFRVGWKPDGSLLLPIQNGKIAKARPLIEPGTSSLSLLSVHRENSIRIDTDGEIPTFCIPSLSESNAKSRLLNTTKFYTKVCEQISIQERDQNVVTIVGRAFALIQILFLGSICHDEKSRDFTRWLKDLSQRSGKLNISSDPLLSIFDALSSGNLREASLVARKEGYFSLSSIIANASIQSTSELEAQMHSWIESGSEQYMPIHLYRIFSLMCGDLSLEENLYEKSGPTYQHTLDWKRRLTMLDKCKNASSQSDTQLFDLIEKYNLDVKQGSAPPPNAWYIDSHEPGHIDKDKDQICVLYRLMRLFCDESMGYDSNVKLSYIISPLGHTSHIHEVSNSFHLASILSSLELRSCTGLSESEECKLLESYALSLVDSGHWEWAVYVILCTFNTNGVSKETSKWKKVTAIEIICRNFSDSPDSNKRREFLETEISIPEHWFDTALSYQSIESIHKNMFKMTSESSSSPQLQKIFENMILPEAFFDADRKKCKDLLSYLESTQDEEDSGTTGFGGLLLEYLRLSQLVLDLSYGTSESSEIDFQELVAKSEAIVSAIPKMRIDSGIGHENSILPSSVVLSEFESAVRSLIVQLNVLKGGGSILENQNAYDKTETKVLKIMSKLVYELASNDTELSIVNTKESSSLLRGKCGIGVTISS